MSSFGAGYNATARNSLAASQNKRMEEKQQSFSFPLLKVGEILQCMHELQIPLGEAELMEPEKHKGEIRKALVNLVSEARRGLLYRCFNCPAFILYFAIQTTTFAPLALSPYGALPRPIERLLTRISFPLS